MQHVSCTRTSLTGNPHLSQADFRLQIGSPPDVLGISNQPLTTGSAGPPDRPDPREGSHHQAVPGADVRTSTHGKGHEEGGSTYAKVGSSLRSPPGYSRASTPKNQSLPTLLLCDLTSDFSGGCPPPPSRSLCQRVNLQLQLIKFLGY